MVMRNKIKRKCQIVMILRFFDISTEIGCFVFAAAEGPQPKVSKSLILIDQDLSH